MNLEALSLAQREQAYSPSSCIDGNYQPYVEAYAQRSAAAHKAALAMGARHERLRYGNAASQAIELYRPAAAAGPPSPGCALLVFIHGGYWQELSAQSSRFGAAACLEHGHAFAAIDYTLAPQASVGQIVAECRAAYGLLAQRAASLGIDAGRIVLSGSSAGAHLVAMLCLPDTSVSAAQMPPPCAAVLVSGIYRLEPLVGTRINAALQLDVAEARRQSPILQPLHSVHGAQRFALSRLCWGDIETTAFKAQSLHFCGALRAAGCEAQAFEVPGRNHFDVILDLVTPGTRLGDATLALLAPRHTPHPKP